MMSLVEFLEQRITDDQAAAEAAAEVEGRNWHADEGMIVGEVNAGYSGCDLWDNEGAGSLSMKPVVAAFVAVHDPGRVLAECQAKREIIELHRAVEYDAGGADDEETSGVSCSECFDNGTVWWLHWPCRTLRVLAAPYAAHPDFDPAWAVWAPKEASE